jgi:hypothetical protein
MRMVLSAQSVPRSYKEYNWDNQVSYIRESVKNGTEPLFEEYVSVEAEESPLLDAVTRKRLVTD